MNVSPGFFLITELVGQFSELICNGEDQLLQCEKRFLLAFIFYRMKVNLIPLKKFLFYKVVGLSHDTREERVKSGLQSIANEANFTLTCHRQRKREVRSKRSYLLFSM